MTWESVSSIFWGLWVLATTPISDRQRIKRDYEDAYKRVVVWRRIGTGWPLGGGYWTRRYEVVVQFATGEQRRFDVEVEATVSRDPRVFEMKAYPSKSSE